MTAVLADVLSRDGAEQSASAIRQRNLAHADHLATLHAIWAAETRKRPPRPLPRPGHGRAPARPPPAAVAPGPLAVPHPARRRTRRPGPRRGHPHRHHLPRPGRIPRHRRRPGRPDPPAHRPAAPSAARPLGRTGTRAARPGPPRLPGPDRRDDGRPHPPPRPAHRPDRPHLGDHRPRPGARQLGRPPRLGTQGSRDRRLPGDVRVRPSRRPDRPRTQPCRHPTSEPPGTKPSRPRPAAGPGVRALPDGRLWLLRDIYAAETAWAPRHVGKELRLARLGAFDAGLGAIRATAEADTARKADDHGPRRAARVPGRQLPGPARPLSATRTGPRPGHGRPAGMGTRHRPFPASGHRRRRRAPPPPPDPQDRTAALGGASPGQRRRTPAPGPGPSRGAARRPRSATSRSQRQAFRARMDEHQNLAPARMQPGAASARHLPPCRRGGDAILQPPKPQITPSAEILQLAAEHDIEPEAGG